MVDFNAQLLNAVFFLAAAQKKELCFNPEDGMIYEVKARSKADCTLLPIGGSNTPIFDFNPEKLIFRNDILERSGNIGTRTDINGVETEPKQITIQHRNRILTGAEQESDNETTAILGTGTEKAQAYIGIGKVDLPRFSPLYTGETAKWSAQVEDLFDKVFAATNKPETIKKTIENYNAAKKFAQNGQIYELKQLADRLQGRINKQNAMQTAKDTMQAQQQARRKMLFSAVAAVIIAVCYFGVSHFCKEMPYTQPKTEISQMSELDKAILEWEQATGKKIYPSGRECLKKATYGMDKAQIIKVINQNIK